MATIYVDLKGPIACQVGFTREKTVVVTPAEEGVNLGFRPKDSSLLATQIKEGAPEGAVILLTPLQRGTPFPDARLSPGRTPLIATQEVDEFTMQSDIEGELKVDPATGEGLATLVLQPYISDLNFVFTMTGTHTSTFEGGLFTLKVNSNQFVQAADLETGEIVRRFQYKVVVPVGEGSAEHKAEVFQAGSGPVNVGILAALAPQVICSATLTANPTPILSSGSDACFPSAFGPPPVWRDVEDYALIWQERWVIGSEDRKDWSKGGRQWSQ